MASLAGSQRGGGDRRRIAVEIPDPVGTFYRYSLPASLAACRKKMEAGVRWQLRAQRSRQDHDRPDHPAGGSRQDRHLPGRRRGRWSAPTSRCPSCAASRSSPRAARRRTCRRSRRASAASARRRTTWPPPRRSTTSTRWTPPPAGQEDPRAGLQHLHGRGPRAALLLPGRAGLRRRARRRRRPSATSSA